MFELVVLLLLGHISGVHRSTSLMSSSLLLRQCPACLVRLAWIVFVMRGRWPYSWCLVRCCLQDLFNIARNILVQLPSSFFFNCLVSVQVVHPQSSIDTIAAWKKLRFILSVRSDFYMIDSLSIAVHAFVSRVSMSFSVDETLLPRQVNLSTSFREVPLVWKCRLFDYSTYIQFCVHLTPTTSVTQRYWRIHPTKSKHYCIVWNEELDRELKKLQKMKVTVCWVSPTFSA